MIRGLSISQSREVLQESRTKRVALLGMELDTVDVLRVDRTAEIITVVSDSDRVFGTRPS